MEYVSNLSTNPKVGTTLNSNTIKATKENTTQVGNISTSAEENTDKELKFI